MGGTIDAQPYNLANLVLPEANISADQEFGGVGVGVRGLKIRSSDKATKLATLRTVSSVESHFLTSCLKPKAIILMRLFRFGLLKYFTFSTDQIKSMTCL